MPTPTHDQLQAALGTTYTIERELGGGGMSRVYVAEERALGRKVVVKVVPEEMAGSLSLERFRREIALAARLQHPHVVPVLSAGVTDGAAGRDGLPYYTMPLIEGETLRARLARGECGIGEAISILRDVAKALAYAHAHGIVHRDIKPENILLTSGSAVVTDFGVAKALADAAEGDARFDAPGRALTSVGVALGTPAYMAPEQAAADPALDHRADLYAWGVIAYEVLSGQAPFSGRSPAAVMAAHVTLTPESIERVRPSTPPALAALVTACLAKRPADRPASAQVLVDALDAAVTPGSNAATLAVGRRSLGVRQVVIGSVAAVALVAIIGIALMTRTRAPSLDPRRVVVAPLENLTGDTTFDNVGRVAADWLTQGVSEIDSMSVVSTTAAAVALADAKGNYDARVNRLTTTTGAGLVVSGAVLRVGDSLEIRVRLSNARTGQTAGSIEPVRAPARDPMAAIDSLRQRVLGALVVDAGSGAVVAGVRPPTYAAYTEFVQGAERFLRYYDMAGARPYLLRAIALDSSFVFARSILAVSYINDGDWNNVERTVQALGGMRDRMTQGDRLMYEWLQAKLAGDEARAIRAERASVARDSTPMMLYLLGISSVRLARPGLAIPALERSDSGMNAAGWSSQMFQMATAYHLADRFDAEWASIVRARRLYPNERPFVPLGVRALASLHRRNEALALADTVLRGLPDTDNDLSGSLLIGAFEARAHGEPALGDTLIQRTLAWYAAHTPAVEPPGRAFQRGRAYFALGKLDSAEAHLATAARDTMNLEAAAYLAVARFLRTHDAGAARHVADSLGAIQRRWLFGSHLAQQAVILGFLGESERATQLMRMAIDQGQRKVAPHYAPLLAPLRGYAPFDALIRPER